VIIHGEHLPYEVCVISDATVPNRTTIYKYVEVFKQQVPFQAAREHAENTC
jgi:hypothetical protein